MDKTLIVIPARSGSKRIKNKNIKMIHNKPMIVWTVEAAKKFKLYTDILVYTDSPDIARMVKKDHGIEHHFYRTEDNDDETDVNVAVVNAVQRMERLKHYKYDIIIKLGANCPCRTSFDIFRMYQAFMHRDNKFLISVVKYNWLNPHWALKVHPRIGRAIKVNPKAYKKRSQDLQPNYCPSGAIWIADRDEFMKQKTFYGKGFDMFELEVHQGIDIDTMEDFRQAEAELRYRDK